MIRENKDKRIAVLYAGLKQSEAERQELSVRLEAALEFAATATKLEADLLICRQSYRELSDKARALEVQLAEERRGRQALREDPDE